MDFVWKIPVCYEIRIRGKPAETSLESFVKSLQVNLYLAGFSNLEPLCSRTKATRFLPKLWRGFRLWQKTSSDWQLRPRKMLYLHVQQGIVQPLHLWRWVKSGGFFKDFCGNLSISGWFDFLWQKAPSDWQLQPRKRKMFTLTKVDKKWKLLAGF